MSEQNSNRPLHVRENLDFRLDATIPRFWNGGDPFKTRFFDAMSLTFPLGERYFISSVRAYRDQITDPKLLEEVKDFTRQEAQHGIVHTQFNKLLEDQGMDLAWTQEFLRGFFNRRLKNRSNKFNLTWTAAAEHITAMMCSTFTDRPEIANTFDYRIRAMYSWHAIEEVEHKAVCFDVMTKVAKIGYLRRVLGMMVFTLEFTIGVWALIHHLLRKDGFSLFQRAKMTLKGAWWLFKPNGVFMPVVGYYLSYYKPGFHPWQHKEMGHYDVWLEAFQRTGDPIAAAQAYAAAQTA